MLRSEWEGCRACDLGVRREAVGGSFVFGEGHTGGIMFVGEGPGIEEEKEGRPFIGRSGRVLRYAIQRLGIDRYYITNAVTCRSCAQAYDNEGQPRYWKQRDGTLIPVIRDELPTPAQLAACLPRLHEEVYMVDPVLIVALGAGAAQTLSHKAVRIQADSGSTLAVRIPGAGRKAVLTEKKKAWIRKVKGAILMPHAQNEVEYLMLPLIHPAFVMRKKSDERWKNPVQVFAEGMKKAALIYDRYMFEVYGDRPPARELSEDDLQDALSEDDG